MCVCEQARMNYVLYGPSYRMYFGLSNQAKSCCNDKIKHCWVKGSMTCFMFVAESDLVISDLGKKNS